MRMETEGWGETDDPGAGRRTAFGRASLTASARILYRSIQQRGKVRHDDLSAPANVRCDLDELTNLGLVVSEDGWVTTIPYHHVVDGLVAEQDRMLERALDGVGDAQRQLRILIGEGTWLSGDSAGTVLPTKADDDDAFGLPCGAVARARTDLAVMQPGTCLDQESWDASLKRAEADLAEGVRLRVVCQTAVLSHPRSAEFLHRIRRLGGQVRSHTHLPFRLILVDGKTAVCHVAGQDETLLLHGARILALLGRLFETTWVDSIPLGARPEDQPTAVDEHGGSAPVLSSEQQAIVRYLAEGTTDEAIARFLGVTRRTVTRRINEIYRALGVQSRFQAGAAVRRMGLI